MGQFEVEQFWPIGNGFGADERMLPFARGGYNPAMGLTEEEVISIGGKVHFPAAATQLDVVSTSENDSAAGTGARTIILYYLDVNYNCNTEIVTLNGTTPVQTTASMLRVQRMQTITAGSTGENEGVITVEESGQNVIGMAVGDNNTQTTHWTVPAGYFLLMTALSGSTISNENVELSIVTRPIATGLEYHSCNILAPGASPAFSYLDAPFFVPEKTDIQVVGKKLSGPDARVVFNYSGVLCKNELASTDADSDIAK